MCLWYTPGSRQCDRREVRGCEVWEEEGEGEREEEGEGEGEEGCGRAANTSEKEYFIAVGSS